MGTLWGSLLGVMLLLRTCTEVAVGQANVPFYWEFINVGIEVQMNGDMWITETQTYVFTGVHSPPQADPGPRHQQTL